MKRLILLAFAITILTLSGAVSSRAGETLLERGAYLMNGIVACGNCHNTRGPEGRFVEGMEFAGGLVVAEEPFTARVPNISLIWQPESAPGVMRRSLPPFAKARARTAR